MRRFEVNVRDLGSQRAVSVEMLTSSDGHGLVSRRVIDGWMARGTVCRVAMYVRIAEGCPSKGYSYDSKEGNVYNYVLLQWSVWVLSFVVSKCDRRRKRIRLRSYPAVLSEC